MTVRAGNEIVAAQARQGCWCSAIASTRRSGTCHISDRLQRLPRKGLLPFDAAWTSVTLRCGHATPADSRPCHDAGRAHKNNVRSTRDFNMPTRNKTLRSAVLGALFALLPFASANAQDTVNLLTQNFPPFSMANDGKNFAKEEAISGIDAEVVAALFKRAGIPYTLTLRFLEPPAAAGGKRRLRRVLSRTPEREPKYKWVGPLSEIQIVLLKRPDSPIQISTGGGPAVPHRLEGRQRRQPVPDQPGNRGAEFADRYAGQAEGRPVRSLGDHQPLRRIRSQQAGVGPLAVALTLSRVDLTGDEQGNSRRGRREASAHPRSDEAGRPAATGCAPLRELIAAPRARRASAPLEIVPALSAPGCAPKCSSMKLASSATSRSLKCRLKAGIR